MKFASDKIDITVELSHEVIGWLERFRQVQPHDYESGGQLFGWVDANNWFIEKCTGPRLGDERSANLYIADVEAQAIEIEQMNLSGLAFLGDWHTHFQERPLPSMSDKRSAMKSFKMGEYAQSHLLLVIAGNNFPKNPCFVALANANTFLNLRQCADRSNRC